MKKINPQQEAAVNEIFGAVLVIAGAGSGKTHVLTERIAKLLNEGHACGSEIIAITFTNKAAREMKERVLKLTLSQNDEIWVSTFHSMCAKILRKHIEELEGYFKNFSIYSESDTKLAFNKILREFAIEDDERRKKIINQISHAKNMGFSIAQNSKIFSFDKDIAVTTKVFQGYQDYLQANNALDFDDLLTITLRLFTEKPHVLEQYAKRFRFILVDEFQDTNRIQYELVKLLASVHGNVFVVGDEDQCIYTWRGANYKNFEQFRIDFPKLKELKLEQNYRSTKEILEIANKVISNNTERSPKILFTDNEEGSRVECCARQNGNEEVEEVIAKIRYLIREKGYNYSDFAVLLRMGSLTFPFEKKFIAYNIPHEIYGGFRFFEREEIKNVTAYLRLFVNPRDEVSLRRIINFPKRSIGDATIEAVYTCSKERGLSLLEGILTNQDLDLTSAVKKKLSAFSKPFLQLAELQQKLSLSEFASQVVETFGILAAYSDSSEENEDRCNNIYQLLDEITNYERSDKEATLSNYLESITLMSDIDAMQNNNKVTISTVHSVKGLEFPCVFIIGMEEGIFPNSRSTGNEELEEERRLAYVAITRAKKYLFLSYCNERFLHGSWEKMTPSCFLLECGFQKSRLSSLSYNFNGHERKNTAFSWNEKESFKPKEIELAGHEGFTFQKMKDFAFQPKKTAYDEFMEKNPQAEKPHYAKGQTILHSKFGVGKISGLSSDGKIIDVCFETAGNKTLLTDLAPLKIIQ